MAVWNVQQVTNWGCAYFAASSTTKPVKATGGAVSNTAFNVVQAQSIATKDQFTGAHSDVSSKVLSLSVTGQTLRAVVQFKSTGDTARDCRSVALLSDNNVIAILSSTDVIFTIPAASTSIVGVSVDFDIVFTNAGQATVDVSTANTAMQSDLDRFVSCHVAGDPETGEEQFILGDKTFNGKVTLSAVDFDGALTVNNYFRASEVSTPKFNLTAGIDAPGPGAVSLLTVEHGIYNNYDNVFISTSPGSLSITSAGDLTLASSSNYKKIYVEGNMLPTYDKSYTLGGEDNKWDEIWANEIYCDGGFVTVEAIEAGNRADFTFNGFVDTLKSAKVVSTNDPIKQGTFDLLCVYSIGISTGTEITGGNRVFRIDLNLGKGAAPGASISVNNISTNESEKWIAVTSAKSGSASSWHVILAVRVTQ